MKKLSYLIIITGLAISCSKVKKDAETVADLKCLVLNSNGDKRDMFEQQIDMIYIKHKGADLVELEKISEELLSTNCPAKLKQDKENAEFEKEMKEMDKEVSKTEKESTDSEVNSSSSSDNFDKMLDDYEEYTEQYLKLYKKAMGGDNSAMNEYPELMEKAQDLQFSITKAQNSGKLNKQQLKRLNTLMMRYMDAFPNG